MIDTTNFVLLAKLYPVIYSFIQQMSAELLEAECL